MEQRSIIIIGAGIAGLAAGCSGQMNDYRTRIFEMHDKPGQSIYDLYRELGTAQANRFLDLTTYSRFTDEASGHSVEITQDLDRLADDLKAFSANDARAIDNLIAGARAMQGANMGRMGMSKPPELMNPLDRLKEMWEMRRVFKYFTLIYLTRI